MAYSFNPATQRLEDESGNPVGAAPLDQMAPAAPGPPPGLLAANARAGMDLSQPLTLDRGGNGPPMGGLQQQLNPDAPPPAPSPQLPTVPPMVKDTSSVTREVVSPAERAAMKRSQSVDEASIGIAGQQGEAEKHRAEQEAQSAQAKAEARAGFEQQTSGVVDQGAADVAKAKSVYDAENKRLMEMGSPKDWFSSQDTGAKVAAVLSLALGAFGGAFSRRGGNPAMDELDKLIERDYRIQQAKITMQERRVEGAKEGVGMARQSASDQRADLELKQAARWNAIGATAEAQAAQGGSEAAIAKAAAIKNEAEQRKNAHLMQWLESQRAKVTSTSVTGAAPAGGEGGAGRAAGIQIQKAQLAEHGAAALATMDKMLAQGYQPSMQDVERMQNNEKEMATAAHAGVMGATLGRATGILARSRYQGLSPQAQQFFQASDILAQKAAAIASPSHAADEVEHVRQMFSLNPGESPDIWAQKVQQARGVIGAAKALGGKFTGQAQAGAEAERAAAPPPGIQGTRQAPTMSADDQAAVQWAQSHPNDPRARRILQLHGM